MEKRERELEWLGKRKGVCYGRDDGDGAKTANGPGKRTDKRTGKEAQRQDGSGSECRVGEGVRYGRPKDATG